MNFLICLNIYEKKGDANDYDAAVTALNKYFDPHLNPDYEGFKLRQAMQANGE